MITDFSQRWYNRRAEYKLAGIRGESFQPRLYEVEDHLPEAEARAYCEQHHYSGSFPAAVRCIGLRYRAELVGTFVCSVPQGDKVLRSVFPDKEGMPTDCGRLVLGQSVPHGAESWLHARARELLARDGYTGLLAFADDVRRTDADGEVVFKGHLGIVYRATNGIFLGRGTARTVRLLPDGRAFPERSIQKIRKGERGWRGAAAKLEALGAPEVPEDPEARLAWLHAALAKYTRPLRHPGPLRYAWRLQKNVTILGTPRPYPQYRYDDIQASLFNR